MASKRGPLIGVPVPAVGQVVIANAKGESVVCWVNAPFRPLAAAFGGYGSVQRTGRRARTTYQGVDVEGITGGLLLDGWVRRQSIGPSKRLLESMASPSGKRDTTPPQAVFVDGSIPMPGRWWVIQALEPGEVTRLRARDGAYLRQDYTITLVDPPDDVILITNGKRYRVRKGDTLQTIAARQLGSSKRWREIRNDKGGKIRDPKHIKPGTHVRLP